MSPQLSVLLPAYNEAENLVELVPEIEKVLTANGITFEIVVVDDGSTDGTRGVMRGLFGEWANVTMLRHDRNRGTAAAIHSGMLAATTEIVCSMDCDCTYDPHELARMIPRLRPGIDVVVASPYHAEGSARHLPWWRRALARSLAGLYRAALHEPLTCYTSSFRVYRRSRLLGLRVRRGGFIGVTETLARLALDGAAIVEHPVTLDARLFGRSRLAVVRGIADHLGLLAELAWLRARGRGARALAPSLSAEAVSIDRTMQ